MGSTGGETIWTGAMGVETGVGSNPPAGMRWEGKAPLAPLVSSCAHRHCIVTEICVACTVTLTRRLAKLRTNLCDSHALGKRSLVEDRLMMQKKKPTRLRSCARLRAPSCPIRFHSKSSVASDEHCPSTQGILSNSTAHLRG